MYIYLLLKSYCKKISIWFNKLQRSAANFQWASIEIGTYCASIPWAGIKLRVSWFGTDLEIGISHTLANGINTNMISSFEKTDVFNLTCAHGTHF